MTQTSDLTNSAKAHLHDLGEQAKDTAAAQANAQVEQLGSTAADHVQRAANAASAAADEMKPSSPQAQATQQIADHIEDFAGQLRQTDLSDLAGQASDLARRNPMLFVGGAALLGFAAARFLKARSPENVARHSGTDPWSDNRYSTINGGRFDD